MGVLYQYRSLTLSLCLIIYCVCLLQIIKYGLACRCEILLFNEIRGQIRSSSCFCSIVQPCLNATAEIKTKTNNVSVTCAIFFRAKKNVPKAAGKLTLTKTNDIFFFSTLFSTNWIYLPFKNPTFTTKMSKTHYFQANFNCMFFF